MESRDDNPEAQLRVKKTVMTVVLSADEQQAKLVPYWGFSAQPASTYYFQVSHDAFGIIEHCDEKRHVILLNERIGLKNTDHTVSYLQQKITEATNQHSWMCRVLVFLDNATNTKKITFSFHGDGDGRAKQG